MIKDTKGLSECAEFRGGSRISEISAALIGERYPTVFDIILVVITIIICPSSAYEYMACAIIKGFAFSVIACICLRVHARSQYTCLMSLYIHVCTCTCMYMYICTYIYVYMYAYAYQIYRSIRDRTYMHRYIYIYMRVLL